MRNNINKAKELFAKSSFTYEDEKTWSKEAVSRLKELFATAMKKTTK